MSSKKSSKSKVETPLSPRAIAAQLMREKVAEVFNRLGGNVSATARELNVTRGTIHHHIKKIGHKKPVAGGTIRGIKHKNAALPAKGEVKRYILTSAQNNTYLHDKLWVNLLALAKFYNAEIKVGTYSYNKNAYGPLAVKKGTFEGYDREVWYDERIQQLISDDRIELANGLTWCGEMNIIPTANDPLESLETYSGRKSAIFPHAKISMRSIATMQGEGTKLNYTTGTVTLKNYIQKKAGLKAEHHHTYGALLVEVNSEGNWWVRQLEQDEQNSIQDLNVLVKAGVVTEGVPVEALTWGDIHVTDLNKVVEQLSIGKHGMLETLKPSYQFIHDLLEGVSFNHHASKNAHDKFKAFLRGYDVVTQELKDTSGKLQEYMRPWVETVVVDSNHDNWLMRWLREHDYRNDPRNALLFLEAQFEVFKQLEGKNERFHLIEWAMRKFDTPDSVKFLRQDESFTICGKKIECGMHGHLGPDGARGTPSNLNKIGRKANTAHTHSAGIYNGLYVAGTSTNLQMSYNHGPSSWSHSHIVTYPSGKRTIVTMYAGKWRA